MQTSSLFARANIQPFCTCKRAILPVANLDTYVVLFVLNKGVKDEVENVFQPKRRGKSLNFLTVSVWRSEVNDVKEDSREHGNAKCGLLNKCTSCWYSGMILDYTRIQSADF